MATYWRWVHIQLNSISYSLAFFCGDKMFEVKQKPQNPLKLDPSANSTLNSFVYAFYVKVCVSLRNNYASGYIAKWWKVNTKDQNTTSLCHSRAEAIMIADLGIILLSYFYNFAYCVHTFACHSQNYAGFNMHRYCSALLAHFKCVPKAILVNKIHRN